MSATLESTVEEPPVPRLALAGQGLTGDAADGQGGAELSGQVARAAPWSMLIAAVPRLTSFAIMAVIARILSPRDFGVFAVALTVHTVIFGVGTLGVAIVITRGDVDIDEVAPTVSTISFLSAFTMSALMAIFAAPISSALGTPAAAAPLRVLALSLALTGCFPIPNNLLAREFRQRESFIAVAAGNIPANILMVILALGGDGAMSFAWSRVAEHAITGVMTYYFTRRFDRPGFDWRIAKRILRYSLPVAGVTLVSTMLLNIDYAVIARALGAYRLGLYLLAFNIASWPSTLMSAAIMAIAIPAFSRLGGDPERRRRAVLRAVRAIALLGFPICALTCSLSLPLLVTIYGHKWAPSAPVLATLTIYGAISVFCLMIGQMTVSQGRTGRLLALQLLWLVTLIPGMILGVHLRGIVGAGDAHVVVIVVLILPAYVIMTVRAGFARVSELLRAIAPPLAAAVLAGLLAAAIATTVEPAPLKLLLGAATILGVYGTLMSPLVSELPLNHLPRRLLRLLAPYLAFGDSVRALPAPVLRRLGSRQAS